MSAWAGSRIALPEEQRRRREGVKQFILARPSLWRVIREPIDPVLASLKPTERELRDYCLVVASNPDSITLQDPLMVYFLAREFLKVKPEMWSPLEIADFVDQLCDNGMDLAGARHEVAELLGRERGAVARTHQKLGRHKGGRGGRPRKDLKTPNKNPE